MLGQVVKCIIVAKCVYRKSKLNNEKDLLWLKSLYSIYSVLWFYGNVSKGVDAKNVSLISFPSVFIFIFLPSLRFFIPQTFCRCFDHYCLFIKRKNQKSHKLFAGFVDNGNQLANNVSAWFKALVWKKVEWNAAISITITFANRSLWYLFYKYSQYFHPAFTQNLDPEP